MTKISLKWKEIPTSLYRSKVPGGGLIKGHIRYASFIFFVTDPDHRWSGRWEKIEPYSVWTESTVALRSEVPGGWLIRANQQSDITFMPDPDHAWDGNSLP